ncbi:hypothetical protein PC129_g20729 [Phytophthora cactorum]|uniref:Uncharacterized protein n=1 Tax=Phytophthora cactorum TaxID=29920 RepID=A0A8T1BWG1_9STRA|nr:hypothetical protein PC117_g19122 [Phytophthora cactorum]KAG3208241.1 hypothetical protein PC129_g20729 [Phytophthora cactorum]
MPSLFNSLLSRSYRLNSHAGCANQTARLPEASALEKSQELHICKRPREFPDATYNELASWARLQLNLF